MYLNDELHYLRLMSSMNEDFHSGRPLKLDPKDLNRYPIAATLVPNIPRVLERQHEQLVRIDKILTSK